MNIQAYSDGGCLGNPGPGGWAYVLVLDKGEKTGSGGNPDTTNNRMELTAVIQALRDISSYDPWRKSKVIFHTDSQYVHRGITQWIKRWEINGWKTSDKKPVKNVDLWRRLSELSKTLEIEWQWVRGHSGNRLNELCDRLVKQEMRAITEEIEAKGGYSTY